MGKIEIKQLHEDSIEEQIKIFMEAFETKAEIDEVRKFWKIKHYNNPCGNSIIIGAFVDGNLAGINAFMPMIYSYKGEDYKLLQSCESGVGKKFRRLGIWSKIITYAVELLEGGDYTAIIGFPNFRNSYSGFIKLGFHQVCDVVNSVLVIDERRTLEAIKGKKIAYFSFLLSPLKIGRIRACKKCENCIIEHEENIPPIEYDGFEGIKLNSDAEWLNWKRKYKNLDVFCVKDKSHPIAYFVVQYSEVGKIKYCKLLSSYFNTKDIRQKQGAFARLIEQISADVDILR